MNFLKAKLFVMKNYLHFNFNNNDIKHVYKNNTLPNVYELLQVALTIPVNSAICEKRFSSIRC